MITIVDYHLNNLRSLENTLRRLGYPTRVTSDPAEVAAAEKLILPGVGAFPDAMRNLGGLGLIEPIRERTARGVPILGVCLGMQLLLSSSEEFGFHEGLGLLPGAVRRLPPGVHIPHMGWNELFARRADPLMEGVEPGSFVYFVHSYYAAPDDPEAVIVDTEHGIRFPAVIGRGNVRATQFHPEKSQRVGERILRNFAESFGGL